MRTLALLPACLSLVAQAPASPQTCIVQGRVVNAEGQPMAGAAVALVQLGVSTLPEFQAATDVRGGFRLEVPAGTYALTATHRERSAAYLPKVKVEGRAATLDPVVIQAGGHLVEGRVSLPKGFAHKHLGLALARVSNDDGDVFVATINKGAFALRLPEGTYVFLTKGAKVRSPLSIKVPSLQEPVEVVLEAEPSSAPKPVKDWIRSHAIPLKTVEAGHGFEDMRPLAKVVGRARVVSLGEATHGTREFFQMKHRMLEFLVSEMGFTAFAIEANLPECKALNDYVLEGKGDPKKGLDGIYFWTWNTQEVLAMVEWMRQWNADPAHAQKVRFYGFDNQTATVAYQWVKARLDQEDPELGAWMGKELSALGEASKGKMDPATLKRLRGATAELGRRLDAKTGFDPFLRRCARILEQKLDIDLDAQGGGMARDLGMAENVRWILEQEGSKGRVMLWAHNAHVQAGNDLNGHLWMGGHLRKGLGADMVVFGFAFREGSFQARNMSAKNGGLREFTVKPLPSASLDEALLSPGLPILALDLHVIPASGPVRAWFDGPQGTFSTGAVFSDGGEARAIAPTRVLEAYDGLFFIAHTTSARPNHPRESAGGKVDLTLFQPPNMGFEEGPIESPFEDWFSNPTMKDYTAQIVEGGSHEGKRWLRIRHSGETNPGAWATVMQGPDVTPYRGKKVRLTGWLKASGGSKATFWLRVDRPGKAKGFFDNAANRAVSQDVWTQLLIEGPVAA
ncbi:MAG: erythromycin esterase family protein, partial [Acidobacteriota bacterium]|nr:erythromycin esterase family protein [Acidobacteriota bacterium]